MTMATTNKNGGCHHRAVITLEISSSTELASAQQRMRVLVISRVRLHRDYDYRRTGMDMHTDIDEKKMLSFPINDGNSTLPPPAFMRILDALRRGNNRLVLREWKQGACWWNLNMNQGTRYLNGNGDSTTTSSTLDKVKSALSMARAEVAGYRLAKLAMDSNQNSKLSPCPCVRNGDSNLHEDGMVFNSDQNMFTPEVLYFSHDSCNTKHNMDDRCEIENNSPWAVLSYFDSGDASKINTHEEQLEVDMDCESLGVDKNWNSSLSFDGDAVNSTMKSSEKYPCHHFPTTMIKIRHEFGFCEPHPRHGRVPTDECLDYAMMILHDVVIPLQSYFFVIESADHVVMGTQPMVEHLRSIGWVDPTKLSQTVKPFQYHDMITVYRYALDRLSKANAVRHKEGEKDERMDFLLSLLVKCVNALSCEWEGSEGKPPPVPPVLCHMDLQPQNLFFRHTKTNHEMNGGVAVTENGGHHNNKHIHSARDCSVASVMDWEEACYADPRFELLLICRKVLANREQTEELWQSYSDRVRQISERISLKRKTNIHWDVGSIEPWLKLETVHSLCTLLLQAMNLLGGGRNPWETTSDLWGKIDRERRRLVHMGWRFCDSFGAM
ncbi:hypothetical protein ACHAXH_006632 [Discostella pseudostelligera]